MLKLKSRETICVQFIYAAFFLRSVFLVTFGALWFISGLNVLCTVVQIIGKCLVHCGSGHFYMFCAPWFK